MLNIHIIPVLEDNYCYMIEGHDKAVAIVDPGEAAPVIRFIEDHDLKPQMILNTHHHGDHTGGNADLKSRYNIPLLGPAREQHRIQDMDQFLAEGDLVPFFGEDFQILETPGHTDGHICFYGPENGILFCGDVLFSMGCGRNFEGTPEDLWNSLQRLTSLPDETKIYCGHEYTLTNAAFCLTVEPENTDLQNRIQAVKTLRETGRPSFPSTIGIEKKTNSFLRVKTAEGFTNLRERRNHFKI